MSRSLFYLSRIIVVSGEAEESRTAELWSQKGRESGFWEMAKGRRLEARLSLKLSQTNYLWPEPGGRLGRWGR